MGLWMSVGLAIFTLFHVAISLLGIGSGVVVVVDLLKRRGRPGSTAVFLTTTILTSVTGFLFPFHRLLPSHLLGVLSLVALAIAVYALYFRRLAGGWRRAYTVSAIGALYFNVFVLVAQLFMKVPALRALAPTQQEGPFKLAQLLLLVVFIVVGILAAKGTGGQHVRLA
jgi:hypothetical protein